MGVQDQLRIDVRREPDRVVLVLGGELDMASAEQLREAVERESEADAPLLVLDLQRLQFVDSTGLRTILVAYERCRARQRDFAITPGSEQVQRLLSVTGVAEHLPTIATADGLVA